MTDTLTYDEFGRIASSNIDGIPSRRRSVSAVRRLFDLIDEHHHPHPTVGVAWRYNPNAGTVDLDRYVRTGRIYTITGRLVG